jgi:MFS family permease
MTAAALRRVTRETVSGLPREFWWLWTSTLVNRLGAFVAAFMALYLTLDRGYSASYAGLVAALHGLGGVISSLGAGVMADRLGRRPTLLLAQSSTAVAVAVLGFVQHPVAIAAVAFVVGMASNASRPAVQAMIADIVRPEDRVRAFSLNFWAINLGFAVSSMAAGFIAEYSYRAGFLVEAGMTLVCAVVVFAKLPESRPERAAKEVGEPEVGLGTVLRDRRFMGVVGLSFLVALIIQQAFVGLPVAMGRAGFAPADYGMAIAVNGVLIVVLQIPVTRFIQHRDPGRLLVVSSLLIGYGFGLTAFAGSVGVFALTVCVWTLGEIVNAPTQTGLVVRPVPDARPRPVPGHVHHVLVHGRPRRAPDVRSRHRPVRGGVAVGRVRGHRHGRRGRVLGPDAPPADARPGGRRGSSRHLQARGQPGGVGRPAPPRASPMSPPPASRMPGVAPVRLRGASAPP